MFRAILPILVRLCCMLPVCAATLQLQAGVAESHEKLLAAILAPAENQPDAIRALIGVEDPAIVPTLTAWRQGELFVHETENGTRTPFLLGTEANEDGALPGRDLFTGKSLVGPDGKNLYFQGWELTALDTTANIRRSITRVIELAGISDVSATVRASSVEKLGQSQNGDYLPVLKLRLDKEQDPVVRPVLLNAIAMIELKVGEEAERLAAIKTLAAAHSLSGVSQFKEMLAQEDKKPRTFSPKVVDALRHAVITIEHYWYWVNFYGNIFRGISLGSVLLVMALGLAITFGLMGVINMAHGELMVVGAYATFLTQNLFIKLFGMESTAFSWYFLVAIPVAFGAASFVGLLLERTIIQFLYKRPLESLLATWGVSLALQQAFRLFFGPANVQINAPFYLQGNFVVHDIIFAYNRVFVVGFAVLVVFAAWLLMNRTPAGLMIRAVMQNRPMASCMGIRTQRVNMLTFAFGSGLAGVAGACLTQLGNVGPSLGQTHIVDCFMVVVAGGVGNILGTVAAALGIGTFDQLLQPVLGAVLGKIIVLVMIILFLQWRPGGLFPTRSRSLD
ncbi:MAG: urea ABC transporter permease subunit UrtB [Verrucomicrobiota bacterium]|nr:urea ABC transporter permease subunit UrtB [Verrucomicrobiota bacterium]